MDRAFIIACMRFVFHRFFAPFPVYIVSIARTRNTVRIGVAEYTDCPKPRLGGCSEIRYPHRRAAREASRLYAGHSRTDMVQWQEYRFVVIVLLYFIMLIVNNVNRGEDGIDGFNREVRR
jgi:hypothetical protein